MKRSELNMLNSIIGENIYQFPKICFCDIVVYHFYGQISLWTAYGSGHTQNITTTKQYFSLFMFMYQIFLSCMAFLIHLF